MSQKNIAISVVSFTRTTFICFLMIGCWNAIIAQESPDTPQKPDVAAANDSETKYQSLLDEIDTYVKQVQQNWNVPGIAVSIVKDGKTLFAKGYGVREMDTDHGVDENTLFAVASNSKAFTTASLAILVDQGKLRWDSPVTKHLPTFKMPNAFVTQEITVRDLVCHRSGMDTFSGDLLWYDTNYTSDEIVRRIRFMKPVSSFRSRYGYQNLMFITAGKVIESISGKTWAEFVQDNILDPLDMERTTTSVTKMTDNFAMPHNESGGNGLRVLSPGNVDNCWGACGINSSVSDMARWMQMQLARGQFDGQQIVSRQQVWNMWQPYTVMQISESAFRRNPTRHFSAYGLGFFLYDFHGRKVVSHGGGLDGMISQLAMVPEENLGVMVVTNSESSASRFIRDRVLECFLGVQDRPDASSAAVAGQARRDQALASRRQAQEASRIPDTKPTLDLKSYAGTYHGEFYGNVVVTLEDEHLVMKLGPSPGFIADLTHWSHNSFELKWRESVHYNFPRGFVNFTIDRAGQTDELIIDQPNNDFWFYELELHRVK